MELPIGMLIYWANRDEEDQAIISGMWYYQEMYVPSTIEEKKQSILDLKAGRCKVLNVYGTFDQILDLLMQSDRFCKAGVSEIEQFNKLREELLNSPENKVCLFDEIYSLKGTSLMVNTVVEVDETIEDIKAQLNTGKALFVNISENWSFFNHFKKTIDI